MAWQPPFQYVYPTVFKGCDGIVFTDGIQMGGWAMGKVCLGKPYGVGS